MMKTVESSYSEKHIPVLRAMGKDDAEHWLSKVATPKQIRGAVRFARFRGSVDDHVCWTLGDLLGYLTDDVTGGVEDVVGDDIVDARDHATIHSFDYLESLVMKAVELLDDADRGN